MNFEYLVTTFKKNKDEIEQILESLNISGNILVGNQSQIQYSEYEIKREKYNAVIYNLTSVGVSRNRNFLLSKSNARYVTFIDDDMSFIDDSQKKVESNVINLNTKAVRYNVVSLNEKRPIVSIEKVGYHNFKSLKSYGSWGIFYDRLFLSKNKIYFNENIGPGTSINHGEDSVFIHDFLKHSKIWCEKNAAFYIAQNESTWQNENRDLKKEILSHGYIYHLLFGKKALLYGILHLFKHRSNYLDKNFKFKNYMHFFKEGIKLAKANEEK